MLWLMHIVCHLRKWKINLIVRMQKNCSFVSKLGSYKMCNGCLFSLSLSLTLSFTDLSKLLLLKQLHCWWGSIKWQWCSEQSGRFIRQRYAVRIQTSANDFGIVNICLLTAIVLKEAKTSTDASQIGWQIFFHCWPLLPKFTEHETVLRSFERYLIKCVIFDQFREPWSRYNLKGIEYI